MEPREQYFEQATELIERLERLDIIYLRVSTKGKGQEEKDQLKQILDTFKLDLKDCILIEAKESAYQLWAQKNRKFNIIKDLIEEFPDDEKIIYVWDFDRVYRIPELQIDFFRYVDKNRGMVLSYRQKYLHALKDSGAVGRAMYRFMIEILAEQAREESAKKADRLLKSLTPVEGKLITNKGNLYGGKLKTTAGKKITSPETVDKIERYVLKLYNGNMPYREIAKKLEEKKVKISLMYITKLKNRRSLD